MSKFTGSGYDSNLTIKEIATLVRQTIIKAKKDGVIDKGFKTSVKVGGGQYTSKIDVNINKIPDGYECYTEDFKQFYRDDFPSGSSGSTYTQDFKDVLDTLDTILNTWNRDDSDGMTDYFDRRYYGDVSLFWEYESELKTQF